MKNRLDVLLRKNKGNQYISDYLSVILNSGLSESEIMAVGLEKTDTIIEMAKVKFQNIDKTVELLSKESSFLDSELLRKLYLNLGPNDFGYLYTDAYQYCGIFQVKAKRFGSLIFNSEE